MRGNTHEASTVAVMATLRLIVSSGRRSFAGSACDRVPGHRRALFYRRISPRQRSHRTENRASVVQYVSSDAVSDAAEFFSKPSGLLG